MKVFAKALLVIAGLPLATWTGIGAYWAFLRWNGEAATYHFAAMVGLRGFIDLPIQLLSVAFSFLLVHRALLRISASVLALACVLTGMLAIAGEAIGMHARERDAAFADRVHALSPHVIGPIVLLAVAFVSRWLPRTAERRTAGEAQ